MPSIYQPRRPRASPLWQLVNHGWGSFSADYEKNTALYSVLSNRTPSPPSNRSSAPAILLLDSLASNAPIAAMSGCSHSPAKLATFVPLAISDACAPQVNGSRDLYVIKSRIDKWFSPFPKCCAASFANVVGCFLFCSRVRSIR
jgi:hypothetical protein